MENNIKALKERIKVQSEQQKEYKAQRKTVNFTGIRTLGNWEASMYHTQNRWDLRHLYIAYAILRNKPVAENKNSAPYSETKVKLILEKYGQAVCANS